MDLLIVGRSGATQPPWGCTAEESPWGAGTGVQNFEWSQEYAIRSPLFVFPLTILAAPFLLFPLSKLQLFYCMRLSMGFLGVLSLYWMAKASRSLPTHPSTTPLTLNA